MRNTNNLMREQGKGRDSSNLININKLYIYYKNIITGKIYAFEYSGLRKWLTAFIKGVATNRLSLTANSDSSLLIPSGTWVNGIRSVGSATGITLTFNGKPYTISSAVNGDEIIPKKHYVNSDTYLTVSATSWGKLTITIYQEIL